MSVAPPSSAPRPWPAAEVGEALIVAGGRGTRLQPLTYTTRKELLPFCGAPFLAGVLRRLAAAGVGRVRLIVGSDPRPFEALRPVATRYGLALSTVPEPEPLDTAGGVRTVAPELDGPVLVLNGDILTDLDYTAVAARHLTAHADATMALTRVADTSSYGVAVRTGSRIVDFVEKPPPGSLPGQDTVNAGTYVLEPEVIAAYPSGALSFERDVFPGLVRSGGHLEGYVWEGIWQDLGTPLRYRRGHRLALNGALDWPTLHDVPVRGRGLRVADNATVAADARLVAPVLILDGVRVGAGAVVGPFATLGRGVQVGDGAQVTDQAVLHDGVVVGAGVRAAGLVAGEDARVAPGVRLGRDVVLGAGAVVAGGERLGDEQRHPPRRD